MSWGCSYCLVIYYHNYISYNSGIVTALCNRIGDVGIFITIRIIIIIDRWDLVIFRGGTEVNNINDIGGYH